MRAKVVTEAKREGARVERPVITSELDLEIKRELVCQALVLARPAPQNKTVRLRKQWEPREGRDHLLPLDDSGEWVLPTRPCSIESARPDAPERCPALEALDFAKSAAPEVTEYAEAHLQLYRCWARSCGQEKESLGQLQLLKLVERGGLVGPGALFQDRVAAQLWVSRVWRDLAEGAYGLNLPKFVHLAGRIGRMLLEGTQADADDGDGGQGLRAGAMEFVGRGLCSTDPGRELPPIGLNASRR